MGEVVSINKGRFLDHYISSHKEKSFADVALFALGVLATLVVPQVFYFVNGGPVSPLVFVCIAEAGTILGLVKYMRRTAAVVSVVDTLNAPKMPQGGTIQRRKLS